MRTAILRNTLVDSGRLGVWLYSSLILPYLTYCSSVWASSLTCRILEQGGSKVMSVTLQSTVTIYKSLKSLVGIRSHWGCQKHAKEHTTAFHHNGTQIYSPWQSGYYIAASFKMGLITRYSVSRFTGAENILIWYHYTCKGTGKTRNK